MSPHATHTLLSEQILDIATSTRHRIITAACLDGSIVSYNSFTLCNYGEIESNTMNQKK